MIILKEINQNNRGSTDRPRFSHDQSDATAANFINKYVFSFVHFISENITKVFYEIIYHSPFLRFLSLTLSPMFLEVPVVEPHVLRMYDRAT